MSEKKQPSLSVKQTTKKYKFAKRTAIFTTLIILSINYIFILFGSGHDYGSRNIIDCIVDNFHLIIFPIPICFTWLKYIKIINKRINPVLVVLVIYAIYYGLIKILDFLTSSFWF
jgi:preprotein translocase subunit SecE